ncbi:uncharacterized protein LOC119072940 isoform X2 [Bradysia coprophila]|uniref:uncharacterized protein LOC119072940 isoform X2 n=1 Tax=Bradysia coprophila TaxID=38358 RepID=UPI00187DC07F|nr:uncharacterized protein LOC119072940 isoform X2 [Bradysia coprophila]
MKIQIIFLIVCVVASFAQPEGHRSASDELSGQGEQQQQNENTIEGAATEDDELADSQEENVNSSNETSVAEGRRCNNWKWRRHNRRYWLRREKEMRRMNISDSDDSNDGERRQPVTSTCLETQTMPQNERTGNEGSHHRHRPREVTNTTTSNAPSLVEPLQEIQVPTTII